MYLCSNNGNTAFITLMVAQEQKKTDILLFAHLLYKEVFKWTPRARVSEENQSQIEGVLIS